MEIKSIPYDILLGYPEWFIDGFAGKTNPDLSPHLNLGVRDKSGHPVCRNKRTLRNYNIKFGTVEMGR